MDSDAQKRDLGGPRTIQERADRLRAELPDILAKEEVPLMAMLDMGRTPSYHHIV